MHLEVWVDGNALPATGVVDADKFAKLVAADPHEVFKEVKLRSLMAVQARTENARGERETSVVSQGSTTGSSKSLCPCTTFNHSNFKREQRHTTKVPTPPPE